LTTAFRVDDQWITVVKGISFEIGQRETVAIVGESGSGKSVTALSIMGLLPAANSRVSGEILLDGRDLLKLSENRMRHVRGNLISMIFQEPMTSLNPVLTLGFQIAEALIYHRGLDRAQAEAETLRILERVRIPSAASRLHEYPHRLSGGMRQRVMIAMALANNPKLVIGDEPTTALDVMVQAQILELMLRLTRDLGLALVLVTHDLPVVAQVCERAAVMYAGEIVEAGRLEDLFHEPKHPYTRMLFAATPDLYGEDEVLSIPGSPPRLDRDLVGCPFRGRCDRAFDRCIAEAPVLRDVGDGRVAACHLNDEPVGAEADR
jgi:peptide/nickel transport system ATP-binding protein